jgi:hypothetical protein
MRHRNSNFTAEVLVGMVARAGRILQISPKDDLLTVSAAPFYFAMNLEAACAHIFWTMAVLRLKEQRLGSRTLT